MLTKALKMKNLKSKCLNHFDSTDSFKFEMLYNFFCVGFITTNENQWRECFKILPTQSMILC
jgi:hypothetical protein